MRDALGVPEVTTHSFGKAVATLIDDEGLSPRIGADQLGHSKVPTTQDRYMSRGQVHTQVADLLDRTIKDESGSDRMDRSPNYRSDVGRAGLEPATNGL